MERKNKSRSNSDSSLHGKSPFFAEMFKLEKYDTRYDPPTSPESRADGEDDDQDVKPQTDSKKRGRTAQMKIMEKYIEDQKSNFGRAIQVSKKGGKTCVKLAAALITFLDCH